MKDRNTKIVNLEKRVRELKEFKLKPKKKTNENHNDPAEAEMKMKEGIKQKRK